MIFQKEKPYVQKQDRGFTLIEVLVALGILAFGILAIASMQTTSLGGTSRSRNLTQATHVAMDQMEKLLPLSYSSLLTEDGSFTETYYDIDYDIDIDVEPNNGIDNTATVTVTVTWDEKGVERKPLQLTYLKNQL